MAILENEVSRMYVWSNTMASFTVGVLHCTNLSKIYGGFSFVYFLARQ